MRIKPTLLIGYLLQSFINVEGHMEMRRPPPRRSKYNPAYQTIGDVDNDMSAPLGPDNPFPCRGTAPGPIYQTYKAGEEMSVKLGGNAPHNGGHCQFALSYNGGKDWIVFYTIVRNCMPSKTGPIEFEYNIPIPADTLPGDKIVFSWNWINASGEREFYMNCIDIKIENPSNPPFMAGLALLVVNLDGYAIIDEFARPGSDDGHALLDARKKIKVMPNGSIAPLKESDGNFTFYNTSNPIAYNVRRPPEYYETSELPYSSGDQFESINQQHKFRSHSHHKNRASHI